MDDQDALRLAALLCSRLTHDLAGPTSAVANGLELALGESGDDAADLTREACRQLARRLAFFRRAYGTGEGLAWDEARQIANDYLSGTRFSLTWPESPERNPAEARLLLNMILCAMQTTPAGGVLEVLTSDPLSVAANGDLVEISLPSDGNLYQNMSPRHVQPVFTAHLAWLMGLDLEAEVADQNHIVWQAQPIERV